MVLFSQDPKKSKLSPGKVGLRHDASRGLNDDADSLSPSSPASHTAPATHELHSPPPPTYQPHRSYVIWKHQRRSIPRSQVIDHLITNFFQASTLPPDVLVFNDSAGPWPSRSGENAFDLQNYPGLKQAVDHCISSGAHLIIPSLGDYSWYRMAALSVFYDVMLTSNLSFTVLDHHAFSSDHHALLKAAVMKFRRRSDAILAARQQMRRELSLTGKYKTKNGDGHVITRQPGGAIKGSYMERKQRSDAEIIPIVDAVAGQAQGFSHLTEMLNARGMRGTCGGLINSSQMEFLMKRFTYDEPPTNTSSDETPQTPQVVYRFNVTKATNAKIANAEDFARKIMPHIVAAAEGALSLRDIARRLNAQGVKTIKDKKWTNVSVSLVIQRGAIMDIEESRRLLAKFKVHQGLSIYGPCRQKVNDN